MKREYSESVIKIVESLVALFILIDAPELKGREKEVTKIALDVLDKRLDEDVEIEESDLEEDEFNDDINEDYLRYLFDKLK